MISDGVTYLAELVRGIVNGIKGICPLVVGLAGCQSGSVDASVPPSPMPREIAAKPKEAVDSEPRPIGKFNITFYYMIGEEEVAAKAAAKAAKAATTQKPANENRLDPDAEPELASVTPIEFVTIYSGPSCEPITEVTRDFAAQLALQGTGKLKDGRVINIWGHCPCERSPCFKVITEKWGTAGNGRPLQPFRTVAVDPKVVKLGSLLHVPELEGRTMPGRAPWGGFVHDGCVIADDTGGGIDGNQLDLFVGRRSYFLGISGRAGTHRWARQVPVFDGSKRCERQGRRVSRKSGSI
jgi:3D (Asp-Asp-Asp) domain-containing protein